MKRKVINSRAGSSNITQIDKIVIDAKFANSLSWTVDSGEISVYDPVWFKVLQIFYFGKQSYALILRVL